MGFLAVTILALLLALGRGVLTVLTAFPPITPAVNGARTTPPGRTFSPSPSTFSPSSTTAAVETLATLTGEIEPYLFDPGDTWGMHSMTPNTSASLLPSLVPSTSFMLPPLLQSFSPNRSRTLGLARNTSGLASGRLDERGGVATTVVVAIVLERDRSTVRTRATGEEEIGVTWVAAGDGALGEARGVVETLILDSTSTPGEAEASAPAATGGSTCSTSDSTSPTTGASTCTGAASVACELNSRWLLNDLVAAGYLLELSSSLATVAGAWMAGRFRDGDGDFRG